MLLILITLYYILMFKLWNLCLVSLLCYVVVMMKYVIDWMLTYMLWSVLLRLYLVFLLMRICAIWIENELKWLNCLHTWKQIVKYDWDESELRWWSHDVMMKCGNMNIGERSIILFIFAYQILMNLNMKATPKGRGLPQKKRKEWRGLLQEKKKCIWRGLPQLNDDMVGTPTRKGLELQQRTGLRIW